MLKYESLGETQEPLKFSQNVYVIRMGSHYLTVNQNGEVFFEEVGAS